MMFGVRMVSLGSYSLIFGKNLDAWPYWSRCGLLRGALSLRVGLEVSVAQVLLSLADEM